MHRFLWLSVGAVVLASIAVASSGAARQAEARWVITDLGAFGSWDSAAVDINERGQIVGRAWTKDGPRPVLWESGKMKALRVLEHSGVAWAINDRGVVVGTSDSHAVAWQDGKVRDLTPGGGSWSYEANAINNGGTIVGLAEGYSDVSEADRPRLAFVYRQGAAVRLCKNGSFIGSMFSLWSGRPPAAALNEKGEFAGQCDGRAFVWRKGRVVRLRVPRSAHVSGGTATNEEGVVVGFADWSPVAFIWRGNRAERLPVLPGTDSSEARAINDAGDIVGALRLQGRPFRAVLWRSRHPTLIGPAHRESKAILINDRGQVLIGTEGANSDNERAYVWDRGVLTELPTLGGSTSMAFAINENNQIVGSSETRSGDHHAVLWTLKR